MHLLSYQFLKLTRITSLTLTKLTPSEYKNINTSSRSFLSEIFTLMGSQFSPGLWTSAHQISTVFSCSYQLMKPSTRCRFPVNKWSAVFFISMAIIPRTNIPKPSLLQTETLLHSTNPDVTQSRSTRTSALFSSSNITQADRASISNTGYLTLSKLAFTSRSCLVKYATVIPTTMSVLLLAPF